MSRLVRVSMFVMAITLAIAPAPLRANEPLRFAPQRADSTTTAETCLAIAWTAAAGEPRRTEHVLHGMTHAWDVAPNQDQIAAAATRIGFDATWRSAPRGAAQLLLDELRAPTRQGSRSAMVELSRDHWRLVWFEPTDKTWKLLDPLSANVSSIDLQWLERHWLTASPSGESTRVWLSLTAPVKPAPAPQLTAHSRHEYLRKIGELRGRIRSRLVDADDPASPQPADFTILVERPFVVIGDMSESATRRWAEGTIRWAVAKMKAAYFANDPDRVLEIWLFDGKASYSRNVERLFGRAPTTPYGYYSPRNGALVMNIQTGGGTLVHELLHPMMERNFPACPSWFNEGLASLYEQCQERDGKIWGLTNWRLAGLQRAINADGVPTFRQLCETTTSEFYDDHAGVHYAQARYLCYYLQERGKLQAYYHAFRKNADRDPSGYRTLQKLLDTDDMAKFQQQWEQRVLELRYP
ncbi:MAG: hypothetical protein KDB14_06605 [Planctomycetales bacterium]|nr:hypothetical protein [Planctomycetales bacterium]